MKSKTFKISTELYFTDEDSHSELLAKSFKSHAGSKIMKHFRGMRTDMNASSVSIIAPVQIKCNGVFFINAEDENSAKNKLVEGIKSRYKQNYSLKSLIFNDFVITNCIPLEEKNVEISQCLVHYYTIDGNTPDKSAEIAKRNFIMSVYGTVFEDCKYHYGYERTNYTIKEKIPDNMKPQVGLIMDEVKPKEFNLKGSSAFYNELKEFFEANNIDFMKRKDHPFYPVQGWWKNRDGFKIKVTLEVSKIVSIQSSDINSVMEKFKKNVKWVLCDVDFELPPAEESFALVGELKKVNVRVLSEPVKEKSE